MIYILKIEEMERTRGGIEPFTVAMIALGAGIVIGGFLAWLKKRRG